MYQWYERAEICYAYLADVRMVEDKHGNWAKSRAQFRRSSWFSRGWTLQELLAPRAVLFFDRYWAVIGSKYSGPEDFEPENRIVNDDVSFVTGIKKQDMRDPRAACVARKFSWLSRRETTRGEDMAYCMLGLCNVNMPLLYGEGEKAFMRLQLEIIKSYDDESIFAWFHDRSSDFTVPILARFPQLFARSGSILQSTSLPGKSPFSMTNKGLQYQVPRAESRHDRNNRHGEKYVLLLDCWAEDESGDFDDSLSVAINLEFDGSRWWRHHCDMKLSNRDLWTNIVDSPRCIYETLYLLVV